MRVIPAHTFDERPALLKLAQRGGMEPDVLCLRVYLFAQDAVGFAVADHEQAGLLVEDGHHVDAKHIDVYGEGVHGETGKN